MPAKDENLSSAAARAREEVLRLTSMSFPGPCGGASLHMLHLLDALAPYDVPERKIPAPAPVRRRAWRLFPA